LLSEEEKRRFEAEKELDVGYQTPTNNRFRINLHFEKGDVSMVARTIPEQIPSMDSLGLPPTIQKLTQLPHGLVLVTGATGSGKSTTLAAMINEINKNEPVNIITLEDPIEFRFNSQKAIVRQRQYGRDFLTFGEGLKHILRQDPDVVMVGEMRDPETIAAALTIAETGHLVFATLHTYSAGQTVERIIDAFPPHQQNQIRTQLALTLRAVLMQHLLPKVGGGRIAARELLINNTAVANLIRENKVAQIKNVLQTSANEGMFTLTQDLKELIKAKLVEREVAQQYLVGYDKLSDEE
jgi:twitching motility protein PilT